MTIELEKFREAMERIEPVIHHSLIDRSSSFSELAGANVYLIYENLQKTGSYKIRGAANAVLAALERGPVSSFVTVSSGNHGQAVAYAAKKAGIPATIVMIEGASVSKIQAAEAYGAKVILGGRTYSEAFEIAGKMAEDTGAYFIHPYENQDIIIGQGTLALDLISEMPDADAVLVPTASGGLLAAMACVVKQIRPDIRVIGVQMEGSVDQAELLRKLKNREVEPAYLVQELARDYVDEVATVTYEEMAETMLHLLERCKVVLDPSGGTSVAGAIFRKVSFGPDDKAVCILGSGNVDVEVIENVIGSALIASSRRVEFRLKLKPGMANLDSIQHLFTSAGATIIDIEGLGLNSASILNELTVRVRCGVKGPEHVGQIEKLLSDQGYTVTRLR